MRTVKESLFSSWWTPSAMPRRPLGTCPVSRSPEEDKYIYHAAKWTTRSIYRVISDNPWQAVAGSFNQLPAEPRNWREQEWPLGENFQEGGQKKQLQPLLSFYVGALGNTHWPSPVLSSGIIHFDAQNSEVLTMALKGRLLRQFSADWGCWTEETAAQLRVSS